MDEGGRRREDWKLSRTCEREAVDSDSIEEVHVRLKSIVLSYNNVPFLDF